MVFEKNLEQQMSAGPMNVAVGAQSADYVHDG
jgi:hypothetical protein